MVTDTGSEEVAAAGMKGGLADYVLKGHLHRLPLAFKESLEKSSLRRDHEEALERLRLSEERYRIISELSSDYAYSYGSRRDGDVTAGVDHPGIHPDHGIRRRTNWRAGFCCRWCIRKTAR